MDTKGRHLAMAEVPAPIAPSIFVIYRLVLAVSQSVAACSSSEASSGLSPDGTTLTQQL